MITRRLSILLVVALTQLGAGTLCADLAADLAVIRKQYAAIEAAKPTSTKKLELQAKSDPFEGDLTISQYADGLTKLFISYVATDHGGADETYYFGKEGLFFVLVADYSWRFGAADPKGEPATVDRLTEKRLYFKDGKCVRQLTRSVESQDAKQLATLIKKEKNKTLAPEKDTAPYFKRGLALRSATTPAEVLSLYDAE